MAKPAFPELRRRLILGGISPWRAGRLLEELRDHHAELVLERKSAGSPQPDEDAIRRLGSEELLARQFLARPELLSWSRRWPWAVYIVAPLLIYPAAFIATILVMVGLVPEGELPYPTLLLEILEAIRLFNLYVLPVIVAAGFALLARRRGVTRGWAWASITLITFVGALPNLDVYADAVGAGIGFSTRLDFLVEMSLQRWLPTAVAAVMLYMAAGHVAHQYGVPNTMRHASRSDPNR